jgi:cardiolipin synthase
MGRASYRYLDLLLIAFVALYASPCLPQPAQPEYPTLPGRFAEEPDLEPLIADQAFISDTEVFVRFRKGGVLNYGSGDWGNRIDLHDISDAENTGPFLIPLAYGRDGGWSGVPDDLTEIQILESNVWRSFRNELFGEILPRDENSGSVLDFGLDDYFLFYDDSGSFQATAIQDKPGDLAIAERIAIPEFMQRGWPMFEAYLQQRGITDRRLFFNTGDAGDYSLPFLFVNRDLPIAVFLRQPPRRPPQGVARGSVPLVQTAGHVAQSHLGGIVFRPVSSMYRLLFVTTDTVAKTITPDWTVTLRQSPVPPVSTGPTMDLAAWEEQLERLTGRPSSKCTIEYLIDGEEFFTRFIDAVTAASSSISIRTYIFDNDDYAEKIGELLKRRSNEGIEVKVLLDGLGTIISTVEEQDTLPSDFEGRASVRAFLESDSAIDVRQAANPWLTGDHVKTVIIDGRTAFTGGMNIAREYRYDWHDMMMELHGPVVDVLQREFDDAWAHAGLLGDLAYFVQSLKPGPSDAEDLGHPVRVLFTRTDDAEIFHAQRAAIRNAQHYVYVENAYFSDDAMLYELAKARRRGVDVRVIMPLVTDRGPITRNNALAANAMLEHGIRVYIYPGMSHVKAAVFDGWACLGSANWDRLSFRINKEINIATSDPAAVEELNERLFERDFAQSVEMTEPFPERWSDYLIEMIGDYVF